MGSGFNFFTNWINKTPGTTGSWVDVDCSADIPSGSTGVILRLVNTGTSDAIIHVRKKGSSDTDTANAKVLAKGHVYAVIGVDSNRVFQAYIANANCKIYLVGYTDSDVVLNTNPQLLTLPSTYEQWVDLDLSGSVPAGATGVILRCTITISNDSFRFGWRKNGSSFNKQYRIGYNRHTWIIVGVDANRIMEIWQEDTGNEHKFYLVGYVKGQITLLTDPINIGAGTTGAWTDYDATNNTDPQADGIILWICNEGTANYLGGIRKNGSSDDDETNMTIYKNEYAGYPYGAIITGLCGMDSEQIFEYYISNTNIKIYILGYCKPSAILKQWSQTGITTHSFQRPFRLLKLQQTLNTAHVFVCNRLMHLTQTLQTLHVWAVTYPGVILKQWFATLQTTHTFKRPHRLIQLIQTLQTLHNSSLKRFFRLLQTLNFSHLFSRPQREIGYAEQLQLLHVFGRPVRLIKLPAMLRLTHVPVRPYRFMRLSKQLSVAHAYFVAIPSVKKTKLFLVIGDLALQLSGD